MSLHASNRLDFVWHGSCTTYARRAQSEVRAYTMLIPIDEMLPFSLTFNFIGNFRPFSLTCYLFFWDCKKFNHFLWCKCVLSAFGDATITPCVKYVHYGQGCALGIRHISSTSKDVQYKWADHQVSVQEDATQKYFPMNKSSLLLLTTPVKTVSSAWQATKSINYEILLKRLMARVQNTISWIQHFALF